MLRKNISTDLNSRRFYEKFISYLMLLSFLFYMVFPAMGANALLNEITQVGKVTLKAGTQIRLELVNTITSKEVFVGQSISFKVINDIKAEGVTVINDGKLHQVKFQLLKKVELLENPVLLV